MKDIKSSTRSVMKMFLLLSLLFMFYPISTKSSRLIEDETELFDNKGTQIDHFGWSVAITPSLFILGIQQPQPGSTEARVGRVTVYTRNGHALFWNATISPPAGEEDTKFGNAVASNGENIVVGSEDRHCVYVYGIGVQGFPLKQKIKGSFGGSFGSSVAIHSDNVIVVGAINEIDWRSDAATGAVILFRYVGSTWQKVQTLQPQKLTGGAQFGTSVGIADGFVVVSAPDESTNNMYRAGSVYVFSRNIANRNNNKDNTSLIVNKKYSELQPLRPTHRGLFGSAIAHNNDRIVVGASKHEQVYVYSVDKNGKWTLETILADEDTATGDGFGASVSIDGELIVVGADECAMGQMHAGCVYVYRRDSENFWSRWTQLIANEPQEFQTSELTVRLSQKEIVMMRCKANEVGRALINGELYRFSLPNDKHHNPPTPATPATTITTTAACNSTKKGIGTNDNKRAVSSKFATWIHYLIIILLILITLIILVLLCKFNCKKKKGGSASGGGGAGGDMDTDLGGGGGDVNSDLGGGGVGMRDVGQAGTADDEERMHIHIHYNTYLS